MLELNRWSTNLPPCVPHYEIPSRKFTYPTWEKENHLQNGLFRGYVSSQEGKGLIAGRIQGNPMFKKPLVRPYFWGGYVRAGNFPKHKFEVSWFPRFGKIVAWNHQYWVYKVGRNQSQMELQRLFHPQKVGLFHPSYLINTSYHLESLSRWRNSYMYCFFFMAPYPNGPPFGS